MPRLSKSGTRSKGTLKQDITTARQFLLNGQFNKARDILMKTVLDREINQDSPMIFYLLGIACFGSNDITAARTHFQTALEKDSHHIPSQLYLVVISILTDDRTQAIEHLLQAQDECRNSKNNKYKKYLQKINMTLKKYSNDEDKLLEYFNYPIKHNLLPQYGSSQIIKKRMKKIILASIGAMFFLLALFYIYIEVFQPYLQKENERTQIVEQLNQNLQNESNGENNVPSPQVQLSDREYKKLLQQIKKDFVNYRDNQVWINANTILHSSTSQENKNIVLVITKNLSQGNYASDLT